ncbi:MAG: cupin domain-containing protein, partial [Terriglobia bacterium]
FSVTYVWEDGANAFHPDHIHSTTTAHVILKGEMTVCCGGSEQVVKEGDRFDVPAHALHSARMGSQGCRYLIGEK